MQTSLINATNGSMPAKAVMPMRNGRPDFQLADALTKGPAQMQAKARKSSQDFEAVFLNSMFSQMTSGIKGEGPVRRYHRHRRLALDADRAIFEILRQGRRRRRNIG